MSSILASLRRKAASASTATVKLCNRCSSIEFKRLFQMEADFTKFVMSLGSIAEMRMSDCELCRFFAACTPSDCDAALKYNERNDLVDFPFCELHVVDLGHVHNIGHCNVLVIMSVKSLERLTSPWLQHNLNTLTHMPEASYVALSPPIDPDSAMKFRALQPDVFDLGIAREWMSHCEKFHERSCYDKTLPKPRNLRVIDCRNRKLIDAPSNCRYVALSYTWGLSACLSSEDSPGSFDKVIEDSIMVTRAIGLRYLWVDRVCIDQADSDDRHHQVHQMHLVYGNSALTIIAAAGSGPSHGLPGINGTLRVPQQKLRLPVGCLISTLPSGSYSVEKSKWSTRGWTYQEAMLSPRRLVFTEAQVLFECTLMYHREVLDIPLYMSGRSQHPHTHLCDLTVLKNKSPGSAPGDFWEYVFTYASKQLTYRRDALDGFRGILNAFKVPKFPMRRPVHNFWGIPIFLDDDDLLSRDTIYREGSTSGRFAINLFWGSQSGTVMRVDEGFPSWSWAAWYGPLGDRLMTDTSRHIDVRVWLKDNSDGNTYLLDDIDFRKQRNAVLEDIYSSIIEIEGQTIDVTIVNRIPGDSTLGEEGNRLYVRVGLGSERALFAKLESYNVSLSNYDAGRTFMVFFLGGSPAPYYGNYGPKAIILEKTDGYHYRRVGFLTMGLQCWRQSRDGSETVQVGWHDLRQNGQMEELVCVMKRFWLG